MSALAAAPRPGIVQRVLQPLRGIVLVGVAALAASSVAALHGGPPMLHALFFGMVLHWVADDARARPGIAFCARPLLHAGIVLLGARLTFGELASLGWPFALVIGVAVASTLACGLLLSRALRLPWTLGVLAAGATAICGAAAALAIAAVLPRDEDESLDRHTMFVVAAATALSTLAALCYPLLARHLELQPALAGLFLGASIHDVAQVVVAGETLGTATRDVASLVKLARVATLGLVVASIGLAVRCRRTAATPQRWLPRFVLLFFAMIAFNSMDLVTPTLRTLLSDASRWCLLIAATALGMNLSAGALARAGWREVLLMLLCGAWIAGVALVGACSLQGG
jgi:uncharacterized integral membrane protein (TIGR00698 family)